MGGRYRGRGVSTRRGPRIGQQRHFPRVLDRGGDVPLLLDRQTRDVTGADLAAFGNEHAQRGGVLVVDRLELERGEEVLLGRLAGRWGGTARPLGFLGQCSALLSEVDV